MFAVVGVGLAYSAGVLGWAIITARHRPAHPVLWIIALVILGLDVAVHIAMSIGSVVEGGSGGWWVVIGTIAIACLLASAAMRPRLAGWALIGSAALMPLTLLIVANWPGVSASDLAPLPVLLGFWSTRAVLVGMILVLSEGWPARARRRSPSVA